jgi:NAD(P)H-hydrate epimerase
MTARSLPRKDVLPRALYTAEQVRAFDRQAIERFGMTGESLMQRAGKAAFEQILHRWPAARRLVVLVGTGNNGGDGFVVARLAHEQGLDVTVLQLGDRSRLAGDAAVHAGRWEATGGAWLDFDRIPRDANLIVDAMLGTGLRRSVTGDYAAAIAAANAHPAPCLAIDVPSGLHSDTGVVMGAAVRAATTVSFIGLKQGLFTADGPDCAGDVVFDGLDVPAAVYASSVLSARRIDWRKQSELLPPRRRNVHKGHFGHVLVIGGNKGFAGAALLAASAALRVGAGLVSLATRAEHVAACIARQPEVMAHAADDPDLLAPLLQQSSIVVVGPGLGRDRWAQALLNLVLEAKRPLVVDADALRLLAAAPLRRDDWVLTPHPGEAAALLGVCHAEINNDRFNSVEAIQRRYGGSVVLKGVGSLVANQGASPLALCSDGNPGMASAGMGDVLSGIIAGLRAQGLDVRDAAEAGVCLHAAAGDRAAASGQRGLVASDVIAALRPLVNGL